MRLRPDAVDALDWDAVDWRLTNDRIAAILGCSVTTVLRRRQRPPPGPDPITRHLSQTPPARFLSYHERELGEYGLWLKPGAAARLRDYERRVLESKGAEE